MSTEVIILIFEAMVMYFLVLGAHSLRHRFGPVHFYALIGGITDIMSWVTDAGVTIEVAGITLVIGSTGPLSRIDSVILPDFDRCETDDTCKLYSPEGAARYQRNPDHIVSFLKSRIIY